MIKGTKVKTINELRIVFLNMCIRQTSSFRDIVNVHCLNSDIGMFSAKVAVLYRGLSDAYWPITEK